MTQALCPIMQFSINTLVRLQILTNNDTLLTYDFLFVVNKKKGYVKIGLMTNGFV